MLVSNHQNMAIQAQKGNKNFMQQQNRPIQKGKRIFLEMRDSQLVPAANGTQSTAKSGHVQSSSRSTTANQQL